MKTALFVVLALFGSKSEQIDQRLDLAIEMLYGGSNSLDSVQNILATISVDKMSTKQKSLYHYIKADLLDEKNQQLSALVNYLESLRYTKEIGDKKTEHSLYKNIGRIFYFYESHDISISYYNKALELAESDDKRGRIHYNLGFSYNAKKEFDLAIEHFKKAEELVESISMKAQILNYMGHTYTDYGQYDKAEKILLECIALEEEETMVHAYHNLGYNYQVMGETELALEYYDKALNEKEDHFIAYLMKGVLIQSEEVLLKAESLYASTKKEQRNLEVYYWLSIVTGDQTYLSDYKREVDQFIADSKKAMELLNQNQIGLLVENYEKEVKLEEKEVIKNYLIKGGIVGMILLSIGVWIGAKRRVGYILKKSIEAILRE